MDTSRRSVLVVVDLQRGFITEHSQRVVPVIVDLVKRWSENGGDIVFTRYLNYPGSPFERLIHWSKLMHSPETDLVPEIQPYTDPPAIVFDKPAYSLFTESGAQLVEAHGWSDLYICGIATESCVLKTAVDAFEKNLTPWLLTDASASHAGSMAHEAGLLVAARFIGRDQLINSADISDILPPR
ncbi:MAG: isochorismatase family cysteine hydrolase [Pseudonocardiaceae bacterium]